jgi:hypothetical protein
MPRQVLADYRDGRILLDILWPPRIHRRALIIALCGHAVPLYSQRPLPQRTMNVLGRKAAGPDHLLEVRVQRQWDSI